jgi:trans-2,3-dihydro-3-hydroxyanthranilate isomerase
MRGSRSYRYLVVDVFTEVPLFGNPLAVFPDAHGLSENEMQAIARELNLSETSFVFPPLDPRHAARLRIFTPAREVDFAGHPTIGTAFALVALERVEPAVSEFVLEENVGPISIRVERRADPFLAWLRTPEISFGPTFDRKSTAESVDLGEQDLLDDLPVQEAGAGNPFVYVPLRDPVTVDRAEIQVPALRRLIAEGAAEGVTKTAPTGVFVFAPVEGGVYARMFAPMSGVMEDPATGSATGPLGAYLVEYGLLERRDALRFRNEQGTKMRRQSFIYGQLRVVDDMLDSVEVGGSAVRVIEGTIELLGISPDP